MVDDSTVDDERRRSAAVQIDGVDDAELDEYVGELAQRYAALPDLPSTWTRHDLAPPIVPDGDARRHRLDEPLHRVTLQRVGALHPAAVSDVVLPVADDPQDPAEQLLEVRLDRPGVGRRQVPDEQAAVASDAEVDVAIAATAVRQPAVADDVPDAGVVGNVEEAGVEGDEAAGGRRGDVLADLPPAAAIAARLEDGDGQRRVAGEDVVPVDDAAELAIPLVESLEARVIVQRDGEVADFDGVDRRVGDHRSTMGVDEEFGDVAGENRNAGWLTDW